jgi:hypothetical protein
MPLCNTLGLSVRQVEIYFGLYLYFSAGLSLRKTSERLSYHFVKRNHVSIWNRIQKFQPKKDFFGKAKVFQNS